MFKEITAISKNFAMVKLEGNASDDLLNMNVIFEDGTKKNTRRGWRSRWSTNKG